MLRLTHDLWLELVAHAYDGLPDEACGLLGGRPDPFGSGPNAGMHATVERFVPTANADHSARTYSIDGSELLRAERQLEADGLELVGVVHSHTHTEAYPSPTDISRAELLADWHFVIVSLKAPEASARSYRIIDGSVDEEPIILVDR